MLDPKMFRSLARRCRELARTAGSPGLITQLRLWATELADAADHLERRPDAPAGVSRNKLVPWSFAHFRRLRR
jgi:hypothetical protein